MFLFDAQFDLSSSSSSQKSEMSKRFLFVGEFSWLQKCYVEAFQDNRFKLDINNNHTTMTSTRLGSWDVSVATVTVWRNQKVNNVFVSRFIEYSWCLFSIWYTLFDAHMGLLYPFCSHRCNWQWKCLFIIAVLFFFFFPVFAFLHISITCVLRCTWLECSNFPQCFTGS